ncbi:hydroperoxide isomerase ALOXE3-like [Genypterus blacodes]|uniref:hydroperoxide isomerase ALOXE3-like n=1 Tax=Genypterus blacodes TaxID=154954 RepID=UPI003F76C43F
MEKYKTETYTVETNSSLGSLLLVKLEKEPYLHFTEKEWYCSSIAVTTPEGDVVSFPCHRWVSKGEYVELRGGKATKNFEDEHPVVIDHRISELQIQQSLYSGLELIIKGLYSTDHWKNLEDMKNIFWFKKTKVSEYVSEHWMEDDFFGYSFLNGSHTSIIKRCSELPSNFPVTDEMVKPFLEEGSSLQSEMQKGKVFLCDYKRIDGIPSHVYNDEPLHWAPCLCLFYLNPQSKLMPIAIQLHQQPSDENPIFLPSDLETDWLLAKLFVKNADCNEHQAVSHLLKTHYMAEAINIATLHNFPAVHPLYKLLIPHFRGTLPINIVGHKILLGPGGYLTKFSGGAEGLTELMRKAWSEVTYSSLCLPENIAERGLESIPNFYYRDDGLKLWGIINSFVQAIVGYYYPSESEVSRDSELQAWISEIFTSCFLENTTSGIPSSFNTVDEVVKFITMVIFTVTGQHSAVNDPQFDYNSFVANCPFQMRKPPPTTKGQSSMQTILETLPNVEDSAKGAGMLWILSSKLSKTVSLGSYPEEQFDESAPLESIQKFQEELSLLSKAITQRNAELIIPYTYLDPANVENSVAI